MSESYPTEPDVSLIHEVTHLPNRRGFAQAFDAAVETGLPFAILAVDVDNLKTLNDEKGHLAGDELLRGVAEAMRKNSRTEPSPDFPGRPNDFLAFASHTGGDEFLVLLYDIKTDDDIRSYVERLRSGVPAGLSIGGRRYVSGEGLETILDDADALMQQDKDDRKLAKLTEEQLVSVEPILGTLEQLGINPRDLAGIARALRRRNTSLE